MMLQNLQGMNTSGGLIGKIQSLFKQLFGLTISKNLLTFGSVGAMTAQTGTFQNVVITGGGGSTIVTSDNPNWLALRNSTNAQQFDIYNTFTSTTNYERLEMGWVTASNVFSIAANKGSGGGTARVLQIDYGGTSTAAISIPITSGPITLGGPVTSPLSVRVGSNATNATATMSNLTNLSVNLTAGGKYSGIMLLPASNSTGTEGLQFDFNGGTATMTSVEFGFVGTVAGATIGTSDSTALATPITATVVSTSTQWYMVAFTCVVNAAGTLVPRFAEVSHVTGTATVNGGGFLNLDSMSN